MLEFAIIATIIYLIAKRRTKTPSNKKYEPDWKFDPDTGLPINKEETYDTGWYLNPETGLWTNRKNELEIAQRKQAEDGTYRFKRGEVPKDQEEPRTYFHHTDTTFKAKQQPQTTNRDIPFEDWRAEADRNYEPPIYKTQQTVPEEPAKKSSKHSEYQGAYVATPLLTENERRNFVTLKAAADRKGYSVSMKVRLADLVTPRAGSDYMAKFGKIKSKHVDFVVYDQNIRARAIIELDDRTHDRRDRQERDEFVDTILIDAGYKVIHTRHITPDILDNI